MRLAIRLIILSLSFSAHAEPTHYFSSIKHDPDALYSFFMDMPKGGELHYHLTGGASPEVMISLAPKGNYCMNAKTFVLHRSQKECHDISLKTLKKNSATYDKILRAWSMQDFQPKKESGHDHFFAIFYKFTPIASNYAPELLADVIQRAARQHELYLEVMALPDHAHSASFSRFIKKYPHLADKQKILLSHPKFRDNIHDTVTESADLIQKARQLLGCQVAPALPACEVVVKLQYIILREQPLNRFFAQALNGFAAANQSTDLVGINIVQAEDGPISLRDYHKQMIILSYLHHLYPHVHIALHAGELTPETLGEHGQRHQELRYHIQDAILTGHAERIGHGVDIQHEDHSEDLLNHMAQASIPIEINLTSNQSILDIYGDNHPMKRYLAHRVPVVLSTDDEGILRTNLTHEYVKAVMQHRLDYPTIRTINRNALTYSFLPGKSLWANPGQNLKVNECQDLNAPSCLNFIAFSEKATLQWTLEKQLINFESKY